MAWLKHEKLDVYKLAVTVARTVAGYRFKRGDADLRDQAVRASRSIVLNIAEGCSRGGKAGQNHYRIALGSSAETCAVLDLVDFPDGRQTQDDLRRIGSMLYRLSGG